MDKALSKRDTMNPVHVLCYSGYSESRNNGEIATESTNEVSSDYKASSDRIEFDMEDFDDLDFSSQTDLSSPQSSEPPTKRRKSDNKSSRDDFLRKTSDSIAELVKTCGKIADAITTRVENSAKD